MTPRDYLGSLWLVELLGVIVTIVVVIVQLGRVQHCGSEHQGGQLRLPGRLQLSQSRPGHGRGSGELPGPLSPPVVSRQHPSLGLVEMVHASVLRSGSPSLCCWLTDKRSPAASHVLPHALGGRGVSWLPNGTSEGAWTFEFLVAGQGAQSRSDGARPLREDTNVTGPQGGSEARAGRASERWPR